MLKRIPIAEIYGNPDQPRKTFAAAQLAELAASIRQNGLKQPITVRRDACGRHMIIMGERRFRAHEMLAQADNRFATIACHVSEADDRQVAIDAIIENDQRVDVPPLEQARAYQRLLDEYGLGLDELATKLGKPAFRLEERLALLKLTDDCRFLLEREQITPTQAWYLAGLSPQGQSKLLRAINAGHCSTNGALKSAAGAIAEAEAQTAMFDQAPAATTAEARAARTFEARVEQVAAMLRAGIADNVVTAVKRVDPGRAGTLADLLAAIQRDVQRLENALRAVAVQEQFE